MTRGPIFAGAVLSLTLTAVATSVQAQTTEMRRPPVFVYVAAERLWSDSGMDVTKGDQLRFCGSGESNSALNAPTGPARAGDLSFRLPVRRLPGGAIIGSVGRRAFPIGANTNLITMPASGRLLLSLNDLSFLGSSGHFEVR